MSQVDLLGLGAFLQSDHWLLTCPSFLPCLLYLAWVRRFFFSAAARAPAPAAL
jgi:hypothetical protein